MRSRSCLPLGLEEEVNLDWNRKLVCIEQARTKKLRAKSLQLLQSQCCTSESAAPMDGCMKCSVNVQRNIVGKAIIKPCYAQQFVPTNGDRMSACLCWPVL